MNLFLALVILGGATLVHAQQGEKGNSIIPFPRVGRSGNSPGLIPFPRIGRDGGGLREVKRQLIPFPRVGKRPFWHMEPYLSEYEDFNPMMDPSNPNIFSPAAFQMELPSNMQEDNEVDKRSQTPNASGGMWFGPRLGKRRKRSVDSAAASDSSSEHREAVDTKTLLKILHNFNWAIVPVKERRNFTPRLGRSSEEAVVVHQRAQPFSPRLGRSGEVASNEIEIEDEGRHYQRRNEDTHREPQDPPTGPPFSPRLGRSGGEFSPRLGRGGDPFSPRLGRSGDNRD